MTLKGHCGAEAGKQGNREAGKQGNRETGKHLRMKNEEYFLFILREAAKRLTEGRHGFAF